ncbi:MAG: glutamate---cysteine ligase / carboxylate-amine ligase [Pseudonocardiales bacterium]|nr:glutamate---cysteine ligase / carboxylate-amine ligase [Pseudonocardiales bacterium]
MGVEEEFFVFDRDAPRLLDIGPEVVAAAERDGADDAQFEKELKRAQAELASSPAAHLDALERDLRARRAELAQAAARQRARLIAAGTCPVPGTTQTTDDARYRQMAQRFAEVERQQLVCAMHVHVDVASDDEGVAAINGMARWLPVLLALSANSPFAGGGDTGYASYRRIVWDRWPSAGVIGHLADAAEYHRTVAHLVETGAARDRGMIYFDARLSASYPTVEIRVCDVLPTVDEAATLAGLCRALVATCAAGEPAEAARPELVRAAFWRAARWGMSGELVDLRGDPRLVPAWSLVETLLDELADVLDSAGDSERVRQGLDRIRAGGTGAARQRAAVRDGDPALALEVIEVRP